MSLYKLSAIARLQVRGVLLLPGSNSQRILLNSRQFFKKQSNNQLQSNSPGYTKVLLNGARVGMFASVGYAAYKPKDAQPVHHRTDALVLDELPNVRLIRKIVNPKDKHNLDIVLFQFQTCPFCSKVRTFLDASGFSYSIVEVDAVLRQDIKWSPYKKVPMLLARTKTGKYVQMTDSTMIVSLLSSYMIDPTIPIEDLMKCYPSISQLKDDGKWVNDILNRYHLIYGEKMPKNLSEDDLLLERKWRKWTDSHFIPIISPNVYRTKAESLETFEWFASISGWNEFFPKWERNLMVYVGAAAMYFIAKRLKKRHSLCDDVRVDLYAACNRWTNELNKRKTQFLGGKKPNLADLAFYGALTSMEGCQAFKDMVDNTKIEPWFQAMKTYTLSNRGEVINCY